jgi:hypothetical protein
MCAPQERIQPSGNDARLGIIPHHAVSIIPNDSAYLYQKIAGSDSENPYKNSRDAFFTSRLYFVYTVLSAEA